MAKLSTNKMKEILKAKGLNYKQLAENTGISKSTIEKLFGGFNTNPSIRYIEKIAEAFDCGVDDFYEREKTPTSPYYLHRKTAELAQEIHDNPDLRILCDASRDLSPEDLKAVVEIAKRMKKTNQ